MMRRTMMSNFNTHFAERILEFKADARKAFDTICSTYQFTEKEVLLEDWQNSFQITFENQFLQLFIEGLGWGAYISVSIKLHDGTPRVGLWQLCKDLPESLQHGNQTDQMYATAAYLLEYHANVLHGDVAIVQEAAIRIAEEEAQAKEAAQKKKAEAMNQKLKEGYTLITNPNGNDEPIFKKPRPLLGTLQNALQQYPNAKHVKVEEGMFGTDNSKACLTKWFFDVGDKVKAQEILCEVETEKVVLEIPTLYWGTLVWLLPEGELIQSAQTVALIDERPHHGL
jgi:biotin carboxyl carrier protein